jgi:Domain of unknown function (DUF4160)
MPKIYEYLGMVFFFYANEHLPIHVHISKGSLESKAELIMEDGELVEIKFVKVKSRKALEDTDIKNAEKFINKYYASIIEKWTTFFVLNKKVTCELVNKKIK